MGAFNTASPGTGRPGPRRRDTSDSFNGTYPLSPTGVGRFFRDEANAATPPVSLLRRKTDFNDGADDVKPEQAEKDGTARDGREETSSPFGSLKRNMTGPVSAGLNAPSSPWAVGPPSAGFGSMGTFGSFALGPSSGANDVPEQRSGFGSMRGESRFKGLLSKTSSEDMTSVVREKPSTGNLGRLPEVENDGGHQPWDESLRTRPGRSDTNPYGDDVPRTGSAVLGGAQDNGPRIDQLGFSAFGLPPNVGARDFMQPLSNQDPSYHQTPQSRSRGQEPMSPTNTNPYQSPEADRRDYPDRDDDSNQMLQRGNVGFGGREESVVNFGSLRRGVSSAIEDRSQTASAGPNRGFASVGGLGAFPGFGSSAWSGVTGTPNKERGFPSGFGDPVFGMADLQSPNIAGLSGNNFFGSPAAQNTGMPNRPSKISSMFPPTMQEQVQGEKTGGEGVEKLADFATRSRGISGLDSTFGRREQEATPRGGGHFFGDAGTQDTTGRPLHGAEDSGFAAEGSGSHGLLSAFGTSQNPITSPGLAQATNATAPGDSAPQTGQNMSQSSGSPASNQLPAPQQRQMVMPDRMRWIYRDPSGTTQGPWSGLEMHDWFKAGFFTAELQVKKLEDTDYEPLAQLVRRIGNSREPFLVPQIGVPHGPSAPTQGNHWASPTGNSAVGVGPPQPGAAQPPFASSFPSFGTTLTAEQQNALERRKQEEQYLMARQKEHLAQQQVLLKQMQLQGGPQALHALQHHSSAHSLHSQPSFGSITSPSGYQPSPNQGPMQPPQNGPGYMEGTMRHPPPSQFGADFRGAREEDLPNLMERMNVSRAPPFPYGAGPFGQYQDNSQPAPQIASMLQDRARLQMEQQQADSKAQNDAFREGQVFNGRLQEFNAFRAQMEDDEMTVSRETMTVQSTGAPAQRLTEQSQREQAKHEQQEASGESFRAPIDTEALSLSEQVQKTAAAIGQQRTFATEEAGLPAFLPPPPTASPLPAPSAQRNRQNVADNLTAESRSQTQTPLDTPSTSLAPWAEKISENTKGPSLRQIQEAEARKAAQQEEIAAAARKAQAEQERIMQPAAPAPGLPSTSTWANAGTPTTPTGPGTNVWAKPTVAGKPSTTNPSTTTKKTLAQIQREEEARKQRQAAAAAAVQQAALNSTPITAAGGKRYADLASKAATAIQTAPSPPASAWTTVGSSGKVKAPNTIVATPQVGGGAGGRASSGLGTAPGAAAAPAAAPRSRPSLPPARASTTTTTNAATAAANQTKANNDEVTRWAKSALGKGLNGNINGTLQV
jgi:PERQ amino acid-rich with GYF domain-containing protein